MSGSTDYLPTVVSQQMHEKISALLATNDRDNWHLAFQLIRGMDLAQPLGQAMTNSSAKVQLCMEYGFREVYHAVRELNLSKQNLTKFPLEICEMTNLEVLHLHQNNLTVLPASIAKLKHLHTLVISVNALSALPCTIGQLPSLMMLNLMNNELTALPAEIGHLTNLRYLWLLGNRIAELPDEIVQLQQLEFLHLGDMIFSPEKQAEIREMLPHTTVYF